MCFIYLMGKCSSLTLMQTAKTQTTNFTLIIIIISKERNEYFWNVEQQKNHKFNEVVLIL